MSESTTTAGYAGQESLFSGNSFLNAQHFLVKQLMAGQATAALVKVLAVTNAGEVAASGTVDIQPMVNQVDGAGNSTPHGTIYGVPYGRLAAGTNAIIIDPQVGDIGIAVFASRDISSVKANRAVSNPGSRRRFDMADALYVVGTLCGVPVQTIGFSTSGISITSPTAVILDAPMISMTSPAIAFSGASLTHNGVNIGSTHRHGGVVAGAADTAGPI